MSFVLLTYCIRDDSKKKLQTYHKYLDRNTLRKKCPYSELFWSVFLRFRTENEEILSAGKYGLE